MLEPKTISIKDGEGNSKEYIISKFPTIQGREITEKYLTTSIPKLGDYKANEETMLKLMCFVSVDLGGNHIQALNMPKLVDSHVKDWEALRNIEREMMVYNCSFLRDGRIIDFFDNFVQNTLPKIFNQLITSLAQSSQAEKQR